MMTSERPLGSICKGHRLEQPVPMDYLRSDVQITCLLLKLLALVKRLLLILMKHSSMILHFVSRCIVLKRHRVFLCLWRQRVISRMILFISSLQSVIPICIKQKSLG
uniref:Uncharacterized protein n=1 Tax=Arundo donax TaxID=35708 RepID=A0A0A9CH51_ARUDO